MNHNSEHTIKEKIVKSTIELLKKDCDNITVRKIASHAGITQGLINYHFQTKDNLINIAAQRVVEETILKVPIAFEQIEETPMEKLRKLMKLSLKYLIDHPNISRISILRDMQSGHSKDNTQSAINAFDKLLQEMFPDRRKRFLIGHIFSSSIQMMFLRSEVLKEINETDISDTTFQSGFIDDLIEIVLHNNFKDKIQ